MPTFQKIQFLAFSIFLMVPLSFAQPVDINSPIISNSGTIIKESYSEQNKPVESSKKNPELFSGHFDISGIKLGMNIPMLISNVKTNRAEWSSQLNPTSLAACSLNETNSQVNLMLSRNTIEPASSRLRLQCLLGVISKIQMESAVYTLGQSIPEVIQALEAKYGNASQRQALPQGEIVLFWTKPSAFCNGDCVAQENLTVRIKPEPGEPNRAGYLSMALMDSGINASTSPSVQNKLPF